MHYERPEIEARFAVQAMLNGTPISGGAGDTGSMVQPVWRSEKTGDDQAAG